jgi:hypothetical protein
MIELLGILGIGWGIKAAADGVDAAAKRTVRSAKRTVTKAGKAALEHLDERGVYSPLERDARPALHAHQDEVIVDDGVRVHVRCKKCGRVLKGSA